jgi:hypothetical protein
MRRWDTAKIVEDVGLPMPENSADTEQPARLRPPTLLCEKCRAVTDRWREVMRNKVQVFGHYETTEELMLSAKNGCGICQQLLYGSDLAGT